MDIDRFDGLARTIADRREEGARDREQFDALTRLVARKGSRRLALAGLLGVVFLGQEAHVTDAQCRSKEGKNKRQCRRREREDNAPGIGIACQDKLFGLCTIIPYVKGNPCCNNLECVATASVLVTACQFLCKTDDDCKKKFPGKALVCRPDIAVCPFQDRCCVPPL